jgi:hypothetical protein
VRLQAGYFRRKKEEEMKTNLVHTIFSGVGLAMGVATAVMSILGGLESQSAFFMLGLGLFALGVASLQK